MAQEEPDQSPKPCSASHVEMTEMVLPQYTNSHGTVFGGRVLQWIDIAGAICAQRHARRKVVTASIDDMHFLVPIKLGETVILRASVNYVHRTSMEIGVRIEREDAIKGEREHAATAYLTFVAQDDEGNPSTVPAVILETAEEERRNEEAQLRRRDRLIRRRALMKRRA